MEILNQGARAEKRSILLFLCLQMSLLSGFLSGCSEKSTGHPVSVSVSIPLMQRSADSERGEAEASKDQVSIQEVRTPELNLTPPQTVSGFDCLVVNVIGPGSSEVVDDSPNASRGDPGETITRYLSSIPSHYETYVGVISDVKPIASAGGELTFNLSVPTGVNRIIQLIGLKGTVGLNGKSACPASIVDASGHMVRDIKATPYLIGYKVIPNLTGNTDVGIDNLYKNFLEVRNGNPLFLTVGGNDSVPFRIFRNVYATQTYANNCDVLKADNAYNLVNFSLKFPKRGAYDALKMGVTVNTVEFLGEYFSPTNATGTYSTVNTSACNNHEVQFDANGNSIQCTLTFTDGVSGPTPWKIPSRFRVNFTVEALDGSGRSFTATTYVPVTAVAPSASGDQDVVCAN